MYNEALRRMGMYRVLSQGVVQFNSVIFRVVAGILGLVPLETVAIVTAIEKILNALLEIPTGFLADKYGRVRSASWGLICVILALTCMYLAILLRENSYISYGLIIIDGILLGIGVPLVSGSIDAFYQEALEKYAVKGDEVDKSFTVSAAFGRWVPLMSVLVSFTVLYLLYLVNMTQHSFIFGILFWCYLLFKVRSDAKLLGDDSAGRHLHDKDYDTFVNSLAKVKESEGLQKSLFMNALLRVFGGIVFGYFIISLGREFKDEYAQSYFMLMASFMIGAFGPGWYIVGTKLPKWIETLSENQYLVRLFAGTIFFNSAFLFFYKSLSIGQLTFFLFFYGAFFSVCVYGLQSLSKNLLLTHVDKKDYSKYLSLMSMVGMGSSGVYQLYVFLFRKGAPSLTEIAYSTLITILFGLIVLFKKDRRVSEAI